jgi:hypothetical protein
MAAMRQTVAAFAVVGFLVAICLDLAFYLALSGRVGWQVQYWDWTSWIYPPQLSFMVGGGNPSLLFRAFQYGFTAIANAVIYGLVGAALAWTVKRFRRAATRSGPRGPSRS